MSITHEKVATVGLVPASPDQAGGADWNEPHVYESGAFVPVGVFGFDYTYASDWCDNAGSGALVGWTRDTGGDFVVNNPLTIPVRPGAVVTIHLVGINVYGLPSGWGVLPSSDYTDQGLTLTITDSAGNSVRPPNSIKVRGLAVAEVA